MRPTLFPANGLCKAKYGNQNMVFPFIASFSLPPTCVFFGKHSFHSLNSQCCHKQQVHGDGLWLSCHGDLLHFIDFFRHTNSLLLRRLLPPLLLPLQHLPNNTLIGLEFLTAFVIVVFVFVVGFCRHSSETRNMLTPCQLPMRPFCLMTISG